MDERILMKEGEPQHVLVGDSGQCYELLCEFEDKGKGFQRVYVQDAGEDVIIEIGKDSAIVGLFSIEEGKIEALFDYIEANLSGKNGIVCWLAGEFEDCLKQVDKEGRKYPFIHAGVGADVKVPMFYRQNHLDPTSARAIASHTVAVDFVDGQAEDLDGEMFFAEPEPGEVFDAPPKVTQAGILPEGWKWVDYPDMSGHLEGPDGKQWFQYDVHHSAYVEFKRDDDARWSSYPGRFEDFKHGAEKAILEKYLGIDRSLMDMDKMRFYVIEDKENNFGIEYFDDVAAAHERFMESKVDAKKFPALGVSIGDGSLDLLHGVNGEAVLVPDIYWKDAMWSEPFKAAQGDIEDAARWLVMEGGGVLYEYQNDIVPPWLQGEVTVLVPVTMGEKAPGSYCDDKILKATVAAGFDAIDSLYLEMHGWVAYDELLRHPEEYVADGVVKVQYLNVNYALDRNVIGIDGQMDISPCEFKGMVEKFSKPYQLTAYDGAKYTGQFRDKHEFIVGSFDSLPEAVKGWYELQERRRVPALVQKTGERGVLFNGYDENDKRMLLRDAANKYGFEAAGLCDVLADAEKRAIKGNVGNQDKDFEK